MWKYDAYRGMIPAAYFLSKVSSARYLDHPYRIRVGIVVTKTLPRLYSTGYGWRIDEDCGKKEVLNEIEPKMVHYQRPQWGERTLTNRQQVGNQSFKDRRYGDRDSKEGRSMEDGVRTREEVILTLSEITIITVIYKEEEEVTRIIIEVTIITILRISE